VGRSERKPREQDAPEIAARHHLVSADDRSVRPEGAPSRGRAWLRALRPLAQGNLAPFLLVGALEGRRFGLPVSPLGLALALLWGAADHAVIVLANDLADEAADRASRGATLLSGGSRVLVEGALARADLERGLRVALAALGAVTIAGALAFPARAAVLAGASAAALALLYAYGSGPRLSYRGGGEWLQALGVGAVLPTVGAALEPAHALPLEGVTYVALVTLGLAGNVATSIPDAEDDAAAGKRSPAARYGVRRAFFLALALDLVAMALVAIARTPLALLAIPLFAGALVNARFLEDRARRVRAVYPLAFGGGAIVLAWALALAAL
jgi:1,4-dihydroxy-2-naphthoate octaprenyltransferase